MKKKVLFVCLGNICRSPSGEAVLKEKLKTAGLDKGVYVDSAGTSSHHIGEPADLRMRNHALKRGYHLTSTARQIQTEDFEQFDFIIAMDNSNYQNLLNKAISPEQKKKISMMTDFSKNYNGDVPDPYFGGSAGFDNVLDIIEDSVDGLIKELINNFLSL